MTKISAISWTSLCLLLLITFWIRVQGVDRLPAGQFTETDGYFYYWQASVISESGSLPVRDMHRWLPLGRDLGQTLNLYGYVLAYTHKAVSAVFPTVTLYHVTLYVPVACFSIGLGALCLLLYRSYGLMFSITAGMILATLPGSIERSAAGFGDRDAFCLMIGILAVITYLVALQTQHSRIRLFWTFISGFTVFLGGMSWEGFGVFLSVIVLVEVWRFLSTETEEGLSCYFLWVSCFVPTLYLASPAYRSGYGFAKHLFAFVFMPPVMLLGMRTLRHLLLSKVDKLRPYARSLSLGLTLGSLIFALGYVWTQQNTFADTTVPLSQNAVMQAMTELHAPHYGYWVFRYGSIFFIGSFGFVLLPLQLWKKHGFVLSILLILFTISTFLRQPIATLFSETFGTCIFGIAVVGCALTLIFIAWHRWREAPSELIYIAFSVWFLLWVALSRDAKRYDFFIGVALSFGTAVFIATLAQMFSEKLWHDAKSAAFKTGCAVILLTLLMFLPIKHAHTYRSLFAATQMRKPIPEPNVAATLRWMKSKLPNTAIVASHWSYGSQLNVLAGVKTITDQDTYLQHWIDLYYRHIIFAKTEREALEFLKTHGATHLMLVGRTPAQYFLLGQRSDAFVPVYPIENFADARVNVWELHYPPDINTNPKYLKTGFAEIDKHLEPKIK